MSDITMCAGGKSMAGACPKRETCYRYTAQPNEYRQAYFVIPPFELVEGQVVCRDYWNNEEE